MKMSRMKNKAGLYLGLGILMFCMLCATAYAGYNYDGYPLETIEEGTLKGDVYVSYGDHAGLNNYYPWNYTLNTLVTNFSDVPTDGIVWAELKVGVWGGKVNREGFANATLSNSTDPYPDGYNLGMVYLNTTDPSSNVDCCGNGVYLIKYNCTNVLPLLNSDNITATINAWPDESLASTDWLDSRIYGAVLIVAYENGNCYTQYWINQGLENLHKDYTGYPHKDANITWFNGTAEEGCSCLTVAYFTGDYGQNDYLHFNPPCNNTSPYISPYNSNFGNAAWNKTHYSGYQIGGDDVANENSDTANYFDLHTFCVTGLVNNEDNNYATFWRAQNDTGTIYDPAWPGVGDGESYYTPFLAVLKTRICTFDFSNNTSGVAGVDHFAYRYQNNSRAPITNDVPDIEFTSAQYNNIKADDGTFQVDVTDATGNYAAHRFVFNVSCCCCNASLLDANVTWNGKGWHDAGGSSDGAYLYIWNFNTGAYEELDNCDGDGSEQYLTGEITANLGNYINNGQVIVLAEQKTAQVTSGIPPVTNSSHIETDYVKLLFKPKA
ncbi:hypothetical protein MSSAC_3531 [Methanosarcina siciliae C2J]|uniref:DUF3344 domain-containing protein n=2 Tax=Methanosarcina siciliae TaxID=38027 RepID=A0A0E3LDZ3_9EURY|nr:hypothetical protein MSSAC_3531 [Methanosarcina siciliae C2J]